MKAERFRLVENNKTVRKQRAMRISRRRFSAITQVTRSKLDEFLSDFSDI